MILLATGLRGLLRLKEKKSPKIFGSLILNHLLYLLFNDVGGSSKVCGHLEGPGGRRTKLVYDTRTSFSR